MSEETDLLEANRRLLEKRAATATKDGAQEFESSLQKLKAGFRVDPKAMEQRQKEADAIAKLDREQRQATIQKHWNAPERHVSRDTLSGPAEWHETLAMVKGKMGTGFLIALVGDRGPGKTQLAVELMKHACAGLIASRYAHAMDIFIDIKGTYRRESTRSERQVIDEYCAKPLLVIDECQERGETEWESRLLRYIIDRRYQDKQDTLLISNGDAQSISANLGDSIMSRCNETGGLKVCNWKSFRT